MNRDRIAGRGGRSAASDGGSGGSSPGNSGQSGRGRTRGRAAVNLRSGNWFMRHKILTFGVFPFTAVLLIVIGVFANALLNPKSVLVPNRTPMPTEESPVNTAGPDGTAGASASASPTDAVEVPPNYQFPKDVVNILVLGTDAGLTRGSTGGRTDCIILASVNLTTNSVSLVSIPRDTYVKIYNEKNKVAGRNRINAAFAYGKGLNGNGITYAVNTVSHFLGNVPVDHYVLFNMDLVKGLIDAVGGVTVDVKLTEPLDFGSVHLKSGVQKLTGYEALTYARDRHNTSGGDFGRVGHQQDVMVALLKELKDQNKVYSMIPQLFQMFSKNITTDLGLDKVTALAWIAKSVNIDGIKQYTVPGQSLFMNNSSIVIANQQDKIDILTQVFGTEAGLNLKVNSDETYNALYSQIKKQFQSGQTIINNAKKLLNDYTAYYSNGEAADLRAAISAWEKASKAQNADDMEEAQQDVQTEYDALKALIDSRTNTPTDSPTDQPTDQPTGQPTVEPTQQPTDAPTTAPTDTPSTDPGEQQPIP